MREKFWKICQNITQPPNGPPPKKFWKIWWKCHKAVYFEHIEYLEKFSEKEIMPSVPHHASPNITPSMWEYAITILCKILCLWNLGEFPSELYQFYHYIAMESVVFRFLIWKAYIVTKIYFSNHSYCLLLIITQCGFLICTLSRIDTLAMSFDFQPTIFNVKIQYSRSCKSSRPCCLFLFTLNTVLITYFLCYISSIVHQNLY